MNYSKVVLTLLVICLTYAVLKVCYFILMNIFFILDISSCFFFFFYICLFLSQVFLKFLSYIYGCYDFHNVMTSRVANIFILHPTYIVPLFVFCLQYSLPDYWYLWLFLFILLFSFCLKMSIFYFGFPHLHLCSPLPRYYVILSNQIKELKGHRKCQLHILSVATSEWRGCLT